MTSLVTCLAESSLIGPCFLLMNLVLDINFSYKHVLDSEQVVVDGIKPLNQSGTMKLFKNPFNLRGGGSTKSEVSTPSVTDSEKGEGSRDQWGSRAEFFLSCVGMSVGIGNIWRFPYLAYQNGGAAFLFPYMILLFLVGKPIYFLELAVGQFCSRSSIAVWKCCPAAKGIGWAMQIICFLVCIYYNVIVAYTIFYTASSFTSKLSWTECASWWGANERCYIRTNETLPTCADLIKVNSSNIVEGVTCVTLNYTRQTASEQYWTRYVLRLQDSTGLDNLGELRWDLTLCLLLAWIIVFVCLSRGIKSSGKVVYFTATFPYIILFILLIRGVTLEGAEVGLKYLFIPKWEKLLELGVWKAAAEQMFYSLGISWGVLIMFGSYNNFRQKTHIDAMVISTTDFLTSILGCVTIFSVLGYLATQLNVDIEKVAAKGPGLAFIVYPEALSKLPIPQLWTFLFFFMLFTLGLDSEFATLEAVLSNVFDEWPFLKKFKTWVVLVTCVVSFLLGLPCVTSGGQYVLQLMDTYVAGGSVLFIGLFEMIVFMWIYGVKRIVHDIQFMLNSKLNFFWYISWAFICPVFLGVIFIISCVFYEPITYDGLAYPTWGEALGFIMQLCSMIQIPLWAIAIFFAYWKRGDPWGAFRPTEDWGPQDPELKRDWEESTLQHIHKHGVSMNGLDNAALSWSTNVLGPPAKNEKVTSRF